VAVSDFGSFVATAKANEGTTSHFFFCRLLKPNVVSLFCCPDPVRASVALVRFRSLEGRGKKNRCLSLIYIFPKHTSISPSGLHAFECPSQYTHLYREGILFPYAPFYFPDLLIEGKRKAAAYSGFLDFNRVVPLRKLKAVVTLLYTPKALSPTLRGVGKMIRRPLTFRIGFVLVCRWSVVNGFQYRLWWRSFHPGVPSNPRLHEGNFLLELSFIFPFFFFFALLLSNSLAIALPFVVLSCYMCHPLRAFPTRKGNRFATQSKPIHNIEISLGRAGPPSY